MARWNLKSVLTSQLQQGTSASELALSIAIGVGLGLFPLLGTTTLVCALVGHFRKLNHPTLQCVNYLMSPFQILMVPVWVFAGEWLLRAPHVSLNPRTFVTEFFSSPKLFMTHYGIAGVHAILAWLLVAPFVIGFTYRAVRPIIRGFFGPDVGPKKEKI